MTRGSVSNAAREIEREASVQRRGSRPSCTQLVGCLNFLILDRMVVHENIILRLAPGKGHQVPLCDHAHCHWIYRPGHVHFSATGKRHRGSAEIKTASNA